MEVERQLLSLLLGREDLDEQPASEPAVDPQAAAGFLSALLAVLVRKRLGDVASLETIAGYARHLRAGPEKVERPMLIESVLRTGAGYPNMLTGVHQDVVVQGLAVCVRFLYRDVSDGRSGFESTLIADAVRARDAGVYGRVPHPSGE